jgi:hypothetical protein
MAVISSGQGIMGKPAKPKPIVGLRDADIVKGFQFALPGPGPTSGSSVSSVNSCSSPVPTFLRSRSFCMGVFGAARRLGVRDIDNLPTELDATRFQDYG